MSTVSYLHLSKNVDGGKVVVRDVEVSQVAERLPVPVLYLSDGIPAQVQGFQSWYNDRSDVHVNTLTEVYWGMQGLLYTTM